VRFAPVSRGPRKPDFFKACSSTLLPCWSGSLHLAKYECTVRHFGKSLGSILHWQPLRSRYSTAQNTSYKSTVVGLVRRRTLCNNGRISSNFSRLMSLAYFFLIPVFSRHSGDREQALSAVAALLVYCSLST
jgi:hypothetical protein